MVWDTVARLSAYKYLTKAWSNPQDNILGKSINELMKESLVKWRKQPSIVRIQKPNRIDKARRLGYKAKQGFIVVRVKVRRGGARKIRPKSGRRPKAMGVTKFTRRKSLQQIAEERVKRKYRNLLPLKSYWLWEDGKHVWFEMCLKDKNHPVNKT